MEKIKLTNDAEFELITNGIFVSDTTLTATILPAADNLSTLYDIFSNAELTKKIILLSNADEQLAVYGDYTILQTISFNAGEQATVTIVLAKPDEKGLRISSLEEQMTDAQEALCDIYEMIIG